MLKLNRITDYAVVVLAQMAVSFLPPALVSIAVAALSHRVAARLRGSEWTLRQTLASATWGSLGLMGTVTAIAIAVPAAMTGHPGLAAAAVLGAVALRWATLRGPWPNGCGCCGSTPATRRRSASWSVSRRSTSCGRSTCWCPHRGSRKHPTGWPRSI